MNKIKKSLLSLPLVLILIGGVVFIKRADLFHQSVHYLIKKQFGEVQSHEKISDHEYQIITELKSGKTFFYLKFTAKFLGSFEKSVIFLEITNSKNIHIAKIKAYQTPDKIVLKIISGPDQLKQMNDLILDYDDIFIKFKKSNLLEFLSSDLTSVLMAKGIEVESKKIAVMHEKYFETILNDLSLTVKLDQESLSMEASSSGFLYKSLSHSQGINLKSYSASSPKIHLESTNINIPLVFKTLFPHIMSGRKLTLMQLIPLTKTISFPADLKFTLNQPKTSEAPKVPEYTIPNIAFKLKVISRLLLSLQNYDMSLTLSESGKSQVIEHLIVNYVALEKAKKIERNYRRIQDKTPSQKFLNKDKLIASLSEVLAESTIKNSDSLSINMISKNILITKDSKMGTKELKLELSNGQILLNKQAKSLKQLKKFLLKEALVTPNLKLINEELKKVNIIPFSR